MSEYTKYQAKAAKAFAAMAQTANLRKSRIVDYAQMLGMPNVSLKGTEIVVGEVKEATHLHGVPRADLTPAAIAKYEAEQLGSFKQCLYREIKYMHDSGDVSRGDAETLLKDLDLPMPVTVTQVRASVQGVGLVAFTLPGEVARDDIKTTLSEMAETPVADRIVAAFPGATNTGERVESLRVDHTTSWPKYVDAS